MKAIIKVAVVAATGALALSGCSSHKKDSGLSSTTISPVSYSALYVVNGGDATISVIDTSTDTVAGTIVRNRRHG